MVVGEGMSFFSLSTPFLRCNLCLCLDMGCFITQISGVKGDIYIRGRWEPKKQQTKNELR